MNEILRKEFLFARIRHLAGRPGRESELEFLFQYGSMRNAINVNTFKPLFTFNYTITYVTLKQV